MTKIDWVAEAVPAEMAVRQVYCIMLDRKGRVMLRVEKKPDRIKYSLAGGRPEVYDNGIEGTCRRELLEEVNTEIETPVYIGYQLVNEGNGTPAYAQVRMAALIRQFSSRMFQSNRSKTCWACSGVGRLPPFRYSRSSFQSSGSAMEQGELSVSCFFQGQRLTLMPRLSARGIKAESHAIVFSPVSPSHSGTFSRVATSMQSRRAPMSGGQP